MFMPPRWARSGPHMAKGEKTCGREGRPWTRVLTGLGSQELSFKVRLCGGVPDRQTKQGRGQRAESKGPRGGRGQAPDHVRVSGKVQNPGDNSAAPRNLQVKQTLKYKTLTDLVRSEEGQELDPERVEACERIVDPDPDPHLRGQGGGSAGGGGEGPSLPEQPKTSRRWRKPKSGMIIRALGDKENVPTLEVSEVHKTDEDPTATCETCGHVGSTESNLRVHIMVRHMKARFSCLSCRKQFKLPSECRSHIKEFHAEENPGMECVCNKCGIDPTDFEEFINHAESEHKMPSKGRRGGQRVAKAPSVAQLETSQPDRFCRYCDFSSQSKDAAKVHMDLFHTRTSYSCQVCGFGSKRKLDVVKHIRNDHNGTVNSESVSNMIFFHCAVCQLAEVKNRFLAHLADHTEDETSLGKEEVEEAAGYSCTRCLNFKNDKSSTISRIISEHMEEHSEESGVSMQEFVTGLLLINCR